MLIREEQVTAVHNGEGQWKKHRNKQRKQNSQAKSNVCNFICEYCRRIECLAEPY